MIFRQIVKWFTVFCTMALAVGSISAFAEESSNLVDIEQVEEASANQRWSYPTVAMDRSRDVTDIVNMARELPHNAFNSQYIPQFSTQPWYTSPYSAGTIQQQYLDDALNTLKMVRYVAGLPYEDVKFVDEYVSYSQHGAVLLAASNQFSHSPGKPVDMTTEFYNLGYTGCNEGNISAGRDNISESILGFIADAGASNISLVGHRRWILNPLSDGFGIGYAYKSGTSYGGHRITMHVFDDGISEPDSYVAWPSSGDFPLEYFAFDDGYYNPVVYPWSINLGSQYSAPNRNDISIVLTRVNDNTVWTFNKDTPQLDYSSAPDNSMHLAVDNYLYGMQKAIVFRPDVPTLGSIEHGDVFNVVISGITTSSGEATTLEYDINFFSMDYEINRSEVTFKVVEDGVPIDGAQLTIDSNTYITDSDGIVAVRLNNNSNVSYSVTAEDYYDKADSFTTDDTDMIRTVEMEYDISTDLEDLLTVVHPLNYNKRTDEAAVPEADVNSDGVINFLDLAIVRNVYFFK